MADSDTGAPPRILLVLAASLAVALGAGAAVLGLTIGDSGKDSTETTETGPIALVSVPAPEAESPACRSFVQAAPMELISNGAKLSRRDITAPAPPATLAWGGDDPIVLRCGLTQPPELTPTAQLRVIDNVRWLPVPDTATRTTTWYAIDREVYLALTVPETAGTGPLQELTQTITTTLPQIP